MPFMYISLAVIFILYIINLLFAVLLHRKYNNLISREHLLITISQALNYLLISISYTFLRQGWINHDTTQYIYILGFFGLFYTTMLTALTTRRLYYVVTNRSHLISSVELLLTVILPLLFIVPFFLWISDLKVVFMIILMLLILSLIYLLVFIISVRSDVRRKRYQMQSLRLKLTIKVVSMVLVITFPLITLSMILELLEIFKAPDLQTVMQQRVFYEGGKSLFSKIAFHMFHFIYSLAVIFNIAEIFFSPRKRPEEYLTLRFIKKYSLTSREIEIIQSLIAGLKNQEICESLYIAKGTLKNHITNIYQKCSVSTRQEMLNLVRNAPEF